MSRKNRATFNGKRPILVPKCGPGGDQLWLAKFATGALLVAKSGPGTRFGQDHFSNDRDT